MMLESVIFKYAPTLISTKITRIEKKDTSFFRNSNLIFSQYFAHQQTLTKLHFSYSIFFALYNYNEIVFTYAILYMKHLKLYLWDASSLSQLLWSSWTFCIHQTNTTFPNIMNFKITNNNVIQLIKKFHQWNV